MEKLSRRFDARASFEPDRDLIEGENLAFEASVQPILQVRGYVVGALVVLTAGFLFSGSVNGILPAILLIYFFSASDFRSWKGLLKRLTISSLGLVAIFGLFNLMTETASSKALTAAYQGGDGGRFFLNLAGDLNPSVTVPPAFSHISEMLTAAVANGPTFPNIVSLLLGVAGLFVLMGSYYYARGQHIFVTDRRIIITKSFWGFLLFQVPIDSVIDASSSRALLGRLSSYGSLSLRVASARRNLRRDPKNALSAKVPSAIRVSVDGIRGPEDAVNAIMTTRMEFLEIQHMKEMKANSKRTADEPTLLEASSASGSTNPGTLPVVQRTSATTRNKCPWCRREFDVGESVYYCPKCRTAFHIPCLESAFTREKDCPECGTNIVFA